ncbi:hypothetical protein PISMIDRAFT_675163 [Pisolithus microcarpus 441]|uniref:RING-type domain-containing protein n=1 Tax=Pisolithus microcarpus 441 TaxID=765257 RepID=A0A0D0A5E4_9AGAM|nr:hypothetical protein BKA83DRAFT_675163 [Pisolithus microcarpus]KIK27283.1 hypothetical protein PISMIDRAFT_675163 [Pisolithus microcarpus 441]
MPSTVRPATPGLSSQPNGLKRYNTDTEFASNTVAKRKRVDRTASLSHSSCASHRENNKRRKKKKKKLPIVSQSSPSKDDPVTRTSHRQLAPPTSKTSLARNIIRFSPPVLEAESSSEHISRSPVPEMPADAIIASSSGVNDNATTDNYTPPCPNGETNNLESESTTITVSLENRVEQLTQELATKTKLLSSHQALLNQVQQVITCQICLEFMHRPYALSPCGHLACYDCLVQWFNAPPPDNRPAAPTTLRKKTCPHCRAVVRNRPIEIWGFKNIVQSVSKSNLASGQPAAVSDTPENQNPNADPWADIFPKISQGGQRLGPWLGEGDAHNPAGGEDIGMFDMEDGGIFRCLTCMHEIWNGVCTGCGCEYPAHRHHEDGDDVDLGYLVDDEPGAEEVDVEDDPGWIGLEVGEGDDVDDSDYDGPLFPWSLWADGGLMVDSIPIYDEDEDEGDEDDGYAGSFIDDEDPDHPRIYELPDDEDGHDQFLDDHRESSSHSAHSEEEDDDDGQESDFAPRSFGGGRLTYSDGSEENDDDDDPSY